MFTVLVHTKVNTAKINIFSCLFKINLKLYSNTKNVLKCLYSNTQQDFI